MSAMADQPDAVFAGCVATVTRIPCLVNLCLVIGQTDFNVWKIVISLFRDNKVSLITALSNIRNTVPV